MAMLILLLENYGLMLFYIQPAAYGQILFSVVTPVTTIVNYV